MNFSAPCPLSQVCPSLIGDSTGTGWAFRRRSIKLLSAGWLPHFRNSSWGFPCLVSGVGGMLQPHSYAREFPHRGHIPSPCCPVFPPGDPARAEPSIRRCPRRARACRDPDLQRRSALHLNAPDRLGDRWPTGRLLSGARFAPEWQRRGHAICKMT